MKTFSDAQVPYEHVQEKLPMSMYKKEKLRCNLMGEENNLIQKIL